RKDFSYSFRITAVPTTDLAEPIIIDGVMPIWLHVDCTVTVIAVPEVAEAHPEGEIVGVLYLVDANPAELITPLTAVVTSLVVAPETIAARAPSRAAPCIVCFT